jgi:hypothetical protein
MSFTLSITENILAEVKRVIEMVSEEAGLEKTAHEMEGQLWWEMLALGQHMMELFFAMREKQEAHPKMYEADGISYQYVGQRARGYISLFGEVRVGRACYWSQGLGSQYPLDAVLSLPHSRYSDWVQEWVSELSLTLPYEEAVKPLSKWLRLSMSKRTAEHINADHAGSMSSYYEGHDRPEPAPHDRILVVSADGKGIPMTRQDSPPPEARRGRGQKKTAKKEATVTTLYSLAPYPRCPDDIIYALLRDQAPDPAPQPLRPIPTGKQVFGTLAGQEVAFEQLVERITQRDSPQLTHHVALTDGNRGLKRQVQDRLPQFTLIVDIIHVTEYLWETATSLLGETHFMRETWVQDALRSLLEDEFETLLNYLEHHRHLPGLSPSQQTILSKVVNYLRHNRDYMDYQSYLAQGYPLGTGVIEGACRHLVKDRFERAGMRWSLDGAQVMLDLRATQLNADWEAFQKFRRQRAHEQRYGSSHPDALSEDIRLRVAV